MLRRSLIGAALAATGAAAVPRSGPTDPSLLFDVRKYGAHGDGKTLDTRALQAAIDACTHSGGGIVYFPKGQYLSGTITLKDGVTLYLSPDATLLGSQDVRDYPAKPFPARDLDVGGFEIWALIYAEGARNIGIEGPGTINGNGKPFPPRKPTNNPDISTGARPRLLFLKGCEKVSLCDVTLRDSGCWTVHLALSRKIIVDGISIHSDFFVNQDGIVLDSCDNAVVCNCFVSTYDDAIIIKASFPEPCRNIAITNCVLTTRCAAIKFGTQSLGGFKNVSISNCCCYECPLGGLKFLTVDGGDLEDVAISNISMNNVSAPITFVRGNRAQDFGFKNVEHPRPIGKLRRVTISGIRATVSSRDSTWTRNNTMNGNTILIAGIPGNPVEGIILDDIHVTFPGGGTLEQATRSIVPERENAYPENTMFGLLPAYGIYLRHVKAATLNNLRFELASSDLRPAIIGEDVEDLELNGFKAAGSGGEPLVRLRATRGALIHNCRTLGPIENFLRVEGETSTDIALMANDFRQVRRAWVKGEGFSGSIADTGNLT